MDKQPIPEWGKRGMKTFAACILLCIAVPGWVEAALGWWKLWAHA